MARGERAPRDVCALSRAALEGGRRAMASRGQLESVLERSDSSVSDYITRLRAAGVLDAEELTFDRKTYVRLNNELFTLVGMELHHDGGEVVVTGAAYRPISDVTKVAIADLEAEPQQTLESLA